MHVLVWDTAIDFNRIKKKNASLTGSDTQQINLVNNFDTTYTGQFDLSALQVSQTDWTWSLNLQDRSRNRYQASTSITINSGPTEPKDYMPNITKIYSYIVNNQGTDNDQGNPPKACRVTDLVGGGSAWGVYHDYNKDPHHLENGGAGTSEGQTLFYNFLAFYADITGDATGLNAAMNYIKTYLSPGDDEMWSLETPDPDIGFSPYLLHWAIDISGRGPGSAVYGVNTCYRLYAQDGPRIAFAASDDYDYASAPDADQWLVEGLDVAGDVSTLNKLVASLVDEGLTTEVEFDASITPYPNVMKFSLQWTDKGRDPWEGPLYTGYQNPATYYLGNHPAVASDIVQFLKDAQIEYDRQRRRAGFGPFHPVYVQSSDYGTPGWTWDGPDPNTDWGQFQYRTFAHLAYYYYLSGDTEAKAICDSFYAWVQRHATVANNEVQIPIMLIKRTERVGAVGFDPGAHGLYAQGLVYLAAGSEGSQYKADAEAILDTLAQRQSDNDGQPYEGGISNGDSHNNVISILNFSLMEAGIAFCQYQRLLFQGL